MMSDEFKQQISMEGEVLLMALNSLIQTAKIHSDNNDLLQDAVKTFTGVIAKICENEDEVLVRIQNSRFYIQDQKLILRKANTNLIHRMLRFLENRNIFAISFVPDIKETPPSGIISFVRMLDRSIHQEDPFEWLNGQLADQEMGWVSIKALAQDQEKPEDFSAAPVESSESGDLSVKKGKVRKSYSHVLSSIKDVSRKLSSDQNVSMRQSVRLVQKMVDMIAEDESLFLGISTIRVYDDYTFVHSLNVAILSMCLGKRIGLTHEALERLGMCGLFHDLGKVEIPKDIVNKRGNLSEEEYNELKNHSMHSARLILKLKAERNRKMKILVPPFEHHMGYDHSGYPKIGMGRQLSLFGRMITIADVYDAITSPRIYRPTAMSPDRALAEMMNGSGTHFDPTLLKVFINMMGVYPLGTLLKFDTGEMGLVTHQARDDDRTRPKVLLLAPLSKGKFEKGDPADLRERNPQTGAFKRNIRESLNPSDMGIQPAEYLL
jgi:HD-GYP domain-containing protein (c-di-GMP phosphodiesterase class II)